jgi:serine/threonine-protein kinase CTR1
MMRGSKISEKSDVYSFGVVLWEMVMMERPWKDLRPEQVVYAIGAEGKQLPLPPSLQQPEVVALLRQCWKEDPHERPSFLKIIENLQALDHIDSI